MPAADHIVRPPAPTPPTNGTEPPAAPPAVGDEPHEEPTAPDENGGVTNHFSGSADKVLQVRDVHGDITFT
jgi:hypothetical protein